MRVREDYRTLTGSEKAAILMLAIGQEHASRLFALFADMPERAGKLLGNVHEAQICVVAMARTLAARMNGSSPASAAAKTN